MNHGAPGIKVTWDLHEDIKNYCAGAQHAPMAMNMEKLCRQRRQTENLRWKNFVDRGDKRVRRSRAQGGLDQRQARASTENKVPVRKSLVMTASLIADIVPLVLNIKELSNLNAVGLRSLRFCATEP